MDILTILVIVLFIAGFVLLGIEMVVPGFSVPGVSGIICLVAGIFIAADSMQEGVIITLAVLALLGMMFAVILWLLSKGKLKSPLILKEEQKTEQGYLSSQDLEYLLGKEGIAATDLRPSGMGDFDGITLDVVTGGTYILKGTPIIIEKVKGSRLIVKEKTEKKH